MKNKSNLPTANYKNESPSVKKAWQKPDVEIISQDNVQSGQAGTFQEGTFTGFSPFTLYNS